MKPQAWILLLALLFPLALAQRDNLRGKKFCLQPQMVSLTIEQPGFLNLEGFQSRLTAQFTARLAQQRIPLVMAPDCSGRELGSVIPLLVVTVTTPVAANVRAYAVSLLITDLNVPGFKYVDIYQGQRVGATAKNGLALLDVLASELGQKMDDLVRDWLWANPGPPGAFQPVEQGDKLLQ